jgi:hypothetical protein
LYVRSYISNVGVFSTHGIVVVSTPSDVPFAAAFLARAAADAEEMQFAVDVGDALALLVVALGVAALVVEVVVFESLLLFEEPLDELVVLFELVTAETFFT